MGWRDLNVVKTRAPDCAVFWHGDHNPFDLPLADERSWERIPPDTDFAIDKGESFFVLAQSQQVVRIVALKDTKLQGPLVVSHDDVGVDFQEVLKHAHRSDVAFQRRATLHHLSVWFFSLVLGLFVVLFLSQRLPVALWGEHEDISLWRFSAVLLFSTFSMMGLFLAIRDAHRWISKMWLSRWPLYHTSLRPVVHLSNKVWKSEKDAMGLERFVRKPCLSLRGNARMARASKPDKVPRDAIVFDNGWVVPSSGVWWIGNTTHKAALHLELEEGQKVFGQGWAVLTDHHFEEDKMPQLWSRALVWLGLFAFVFGFLSFVHMDVLWGDDRHVGALIWVFVSWSVGLALVFKSISLLASQNLTEIEGSPGVDLLPFVSHPVLEDQIGSLSKKAEQS